MKKLLGAVLLAVTLSIAPVGCTSLGGGAHKTEVVTIPTVNAAIEQWSVYVNKGKATQAQLLSVKAAYMDYFKAQAAAKAAELLWVKSKTDADQSTLVTAVAEASTKGAAVIALIATYMTAKK